MITDQAFGECVYPVMFGGEKPGQDKFDKLKEVLGWLETFVAEDKFSAGTDCITLGDLALLATYSTMKVGRPAVVPVSSSRFPDKNICPVRRLSWLISTWPHSLTARPGLRSAASSSPTTRR